MEDFELRDLELGVLPDLEERTFETEEFAGKQVHALEADTAVEHLERQDENYVRIGNNLEGPEVKADLGSGYYFELLNRGGGEKSGETEIRVASETGQGSETVYESRFDTLVKRERKSRKAAEMAVAKMEEEGDVWDVFRQQLDGRNFKEAAEDNFRDGVNFDAITVPYSFLFELKPWQDIDSDRIKEYEGEMPGGEYGDESEIEKYHYWFQKYLSNVAELAAYRSGEVDRDIGRIWLEDNPDMGNPA